MTSVAFRGEGGILEEEIGKPRRNSVQFLYLSHPTFHISKYSQQPNLEGIWRAFRQRLTVCR